MAKCVIVGGGLSGLSTAYLLSRLPRSQVSHISLYEASERFGGCFLTCRSPQTGSLHDLGPHSARIAEPSTSPLLRLLSSVGFTRKEVIWMPALTRYIYAAGALRPINFFSLKAEPPFSRSHLSLFIRRALTKGPGPVTYDISVDEFLRTRLDDEFADYLGTALMRGICGADSQLVSASAFLGHMIEWEKEAPNLIIGAVKNIIKGKMRSMYPPKSNNISSEILDAILPPLNEDISPPHNSSVLNLAGGMQSLTDRLVEVLSKQANVTLRKGASVRSLYHHDEQYQLEISMQRSNSLVNASADAVFICTPPMQMGTLLESKSIVPKSVTSLLYPTVFPTSSIAVAALEFDILNLDYPRGFGHLLPICEDEVVMGVIYDSFCSPLMDGRTQKDSIRTTRFTVMLSPRVAWLNAISNQTSFDLEPGLQDEIIYTSVNALEKHIGFKLERPYFAHVGIWSNTIPAYPVDHLENVKKIRNSIKDQLGPKDSCTLQLVGSALDGVGIGDCVKSALKSVGKFANQFKM